MFQGETAITIDDKGRLAIPTAYRELVARGCGNRLVLVYNVYDAGCLWLLQHAQWETLRDQLNARGMKSAQVRTLRRKFTRLHGETPCAFLGRRRIEQAQRRLLESDDKMADIAQALRFENEFHFSRRFKRFTGLSPRAYRDLHRNR